MNSVSVAVIGAGLAGLACAQSLAAPGHRPRVFEQFREPGGRIATHRCGTAAFDHGAQYLTAREPAFRATVAAAEAAGAIARWRPEWPGGEQETSALWVGTPGMSGLPRWLAQGLDIEYGARIVRLERAPVGWALGDERGIEHAHFQTVVLALPAPEAARLAAPHTPLAGRVRAVPMAPCWAVMVAFAESLRGVADAGFADDPVLPWFARDGSKPGRGTPDTWVLHASADYSRRESAAAPARVQEDLIGRFIERTVRTRPPVLLSDCHRWRHARVEAPLGEPFLLDRAAGIGFCGDWCLDARGEAAWLSGQALGAALLRA